MSRALITLLAASLCTQVFAEAPRSRPARAAFQRVNLCPATGKPRGPCPGYVVDHITPLCAGGADHPGNMQWQTVADAKAKDAEERRRCRKTP